MPSKIVHFAGHIIDSLMLSKVLDLILNDGGQYHISRISIGKTRRDVSHAEIRISAADTDTLERIVLTVQKHGVTTDEQSASTRGQ